MALQMELRWRKRPRLRHRENARYRGGIYTIKLLLLLSIFLQIAIMA